MWTSCIVLESILCSKMNFLLCDLIMVLDNDAISIAFLASYIAAASSLTPLMYRSCDVQ